MVKKTIFQNLIIFFLSTFCSCVSFPPLTAAGEEPFADTPEKKQERVERLRHAHSVQIDTGFAYYRNRSNESIASELRVNGFDGVYYYVISDRGIIPGLVGEIQRQNLAVALMTLPSLVYWNDAELAARLPENWRSWLIEFTTPEMDAYRFIGFVYPEYNRWYKEYLGNMLQTHNFDGFTFAEIMYPIYDGPTRNKVLYGDISPGFQAAFRQATGETQFPNFSDPANPDYFKNNPELYHKLVEFRVETINAFYDDIVNGPNGVRERMPEIAFATWTLGINLPNGVAKLREWEGNDIAAMIRRVQPDIHFIQTHVPDWSNPALPPDYAIAYRPFFEAIRQADPDVAIGLQADFGSQAATRRKPEWRETFLQACEVAGVATTTYYEFALRSEVFTAPPVLKELRRQGESLQLIFDQRLGSSSPEKMRQRLLTDESGRQYILRHAILDGNILIATLSPIPSVGTVLRVPLGGLTDDPSVLFGVSADSEEIDQPANAIPENTVISLPVLPENQF